jgi:DHA1 family bicyclomycin/chloramphenicol resistance-like MFS transporter
MGQLVLIFFIMLIQTFTLFSTDMYMPALPSMAAFFGTSEITVNFTLVVFFIFSPIGVLLFGSLSDKYGRKPILYFGTITYAIASILCAFSSTVWMLIGIRAVQALAAGAAQVVSTAMVKDLFSGKARENVLICIQAAVVIGPIIAPVVGAFIIGVFSWRATFVILCALGIFSLLLTIGFKESLPPEERITEPAIRSFLRLGVVLKQKNFTVFLGISSVFTALPFLAYLTASSYIYEDFFGFSAQVYSFFFAATAAGSMLGLMLYNPALKFFTRKTLTTILIAVSGTSGICLFLFGESSPYAFFAIILFFYIAGVIVRPYSMNILLESQDSDIGSASALINCSFNVLCIIGVLISTLLGTNYILNVAVTITLGALISGVLWIYFLRSSLTIKGIKK